MTKKELLKDKINEYVIDILSNAEEQGQLDYFTLEINNHQGKLKMGYKFTNRKTVY